jgi:hypothetical protein
MTKSPDPGFAFWSDDTIDRDIALANLHTSVRDEIDRRRDSYPKMVKQRRMTELECAAEIDLFRAIATELAFALDVAAGRQSDFQAARPKTPFTWAQKLNAIRREICIRRNTFPAKVEKGRLTPAEAASSLAHIEALHAWYWYHGLNFMEGDTPAAIRAAIAAEIDRRWAWAVTAGLNPDCAHSDAIYSGDWSACPKLQPAEEAA